MDGQAFGDAFRILFGCLFAVIAALALAVVVLSGFLIAGCAH